MVGRSLGLALLVHLSAAGAAVGQQTDSLPPGVTAKMVTDGAALFKGAGLCSACHGADAKGLPSLGPDLTDAKWLHSKGTYDEIVKQVALGVAADKSTTGMIMPPKGGSAITDAQVKAVAAYVWSVSRGKK
ncbi:MAG: c-type cytochrome [Gemmatimonadetes bacterium]|nr:c-type cytochrome [Gemmatimonadota bacterium]